MYSLAQTSDGYLWIGASKGLIRFDGINFVSVHAGVSEVIANPAIVGLATDADGQLWASNGLQIFRLANGELKEGLPGKGPQPNQEVLVAKSPSGQLLFSAGLEGISTYEHGASRLIVAPGELPSAAMALALNPEGALWIGTHTGLCVHDAGAGAGSVRCIGGLPDAQINALLEMGQGELLVGTNRGLWRWEAGAVTQVGIAPELRERQILALAVDLDGSVWVGTETGLLRAGRKQPSFSPNLQMVETLTSGAAVTALLEDREGNMWVGTPEGIERHRGNAFTTYSFSGGLQSENSGPIYVDHEDWVWFAPSDGGLFRFQGNRVEPVELPGVRGDGVYSIDGGDGEVWVGRKRGGLTRFRTHGTSMDAVTYTQAGGLAQVYSVYRSPDGIVWAGTLGAGLTRVQSGTLETFTAADGLPSNTISAIAGNASGDTFVGTPNGLGEFHNHVWSTYSTAEGLPPGAIDCLFMDSSGTLWIGTTKGIAFLRSRKIEVPQNVPDPLSEEILGIAESDGWLWISTSDHVLRVRRDALNKGVLEESDYRQYGDAEGLASVVGVKRTRSVVKDDRGRIWFSLNGGISVMQPAILARQSARPMIHLEEMQVDDKTVALGSKIHLASGRRRLIFRFASVSLTDPDKIRYRYRLDDYDAAWSQPGAGREAPYQNLPPGKFHFRVMARNADGLWSAQEAGLNFEVERAYWQTPLFQLACFVACCLMAAGLYRLRLLQLTRRLNLRFEERLAERARIGRELHDTLLQNLTGLALQISGVAKIVKAPERAVEGLQELKRQAEDCVREARQSVWDIRSAEVDLEDLAAALQNSGQQLTAGRTVRFRLNQTGEPYELASEVRRHLLRIAREAIGNAVQHSAAAEIRVDLNYSTQGIRLLVVDDGIGFEMEKGQKMTGHFGLATMKERAEQIRASITVSSAAGVGTSIEVQLPRKVLKH